MSRPLVPVPIAILANPVLIVMARPVVPLMLVVFPASTIATAAAMPFSVGIRAPVPVVPFCGSVASVVMAMLVSSLFPVSTLLFLLSLSLIGGELLLEFVEAVHADVGLWVVRREIWRRRKNKLVKRQSATWLAESGNAHLVAGYDVGGLLRLCWGLSGELFLLM